MERSTYKSSYLLLPVLVFFFSVNACLVVCTDLLQGLKAKAASQAQAAWAQVYWVRRGQLYEERTWQDDWAIFTAKYSVEYCRVKLQAKERKDTAAFIDRLEEDIRKQEERARNTRARRAHAAKTFRGHALEP